MAVINGTSLLLYSDGVVIAYQKGLTISVDQDLPDATNKESAGWAQHINGLKNAKVDFDALFSASASPAESAADLMNYIINKETLLVMILGLGYPLLGWADMSSLSFNAPQEGTMSLSGSLKINGELVVASGVNLVTDPDVGGTDYEIHTETGVGFASLINAAGAAYAKSNTFAVTNTSVYKLLVNVTMVSGQLPNVALFEVGGGAAAISNVVTLANGLNLVTLTATDTHNGCLNFSNTGATSLGTSTIYLFKK
jgi:predicted secreted protein